MRLAALLVLPALAAALVACGGDALSLDSVAKAATKTASQTSEEVAIRGSVDVEGQRVVFAGTGAFDNKRRLGTLTMRFYGPQMNGTIHSVMSRWKLYMRSSLFTPIPGGKRWIELDLQKAGKSVGVDFNALSSSDPTQALARLKQVGDISKVGSEDIAGISTTHYTATVDTTKIPQAVKISRLTHLIYGPVDVWVDSQGLVRRLQLDYTADVTPGSDARAHTVMTTSFSSFGNPVRVRVPSADEALDLTKVATSALQQNGG